MKAKINKTKADYFIPSECFNCHFDDKQIDCGAYNRFKPNYCANCQCFYCTRGQCIKRNNK